MVLLQYLNLEKICHQLNVKNNNCSNKKSASSNKHSDRPLKKKQTLHIKLIILLLAGLWIGIQLTDGLDGRALNLTMEVTFLDK